RPRGGGEPVTASVEQVVALLIYQHPLLRPNFCPTFTRFEAAACDDAVMRVGSLGSAALALGVVALTGCGSGAKPYAASATVACLRDRVAAISQPSRAAARELRHGPHRTR